MNCVWRAAKVISGVPTRSISGLFLLNRDLFCEANPIPVKWAVEQMKLIGPGIRLPLTPLSGEFHERVRKALRAAGIQS